jgi:hypothetical protein
MYKIIRSKETSQRNGDNLNNIKDTKPPGISGIKRGNI